jgi:hypothetical protein
MRVWSVGIVVGRREEDERSGARDTLDVDDG